jgi:hypothetical protein
MNSAREFCCAPAASAYIRITGHGNAGSGQQPRKRRRCIMTRDQLNRELRMHSATWQSVAVMYGLLVGTLVLSAMAVTA